MIGSLFLCLACATLCIEMPARYESWLREAALQQFNPHDTQIILNVLYYSYERSAITLHTQKQAIQSLGEHWNAWHECASRRLDPNAHKATICESSAVLYENFIACAEEYHAIHTRYAHLISYATLSSSYQEQENLEVVRSLREQARSRVFEAIRTVLVEIKQQIEQLLLSQHSALRSIDGCIHDIFEQSDIIELQSKQYGLFNSMLNQLAVNSFAEFNNSFTQKTNILFRSFLQAQEQFNTLWKAIETARRAYYAEQYCMLYQAMKENGYPSESFCSIVDQEGIVSTGHPLPSPNTLVTL